MQGQKAIRRWEGPVLFDVKPALERLLLLTAGELISHMELCTA